MTHARTVLIAVALLVVATAPVGAQAAARGQVRLVIGPSMHLEVLPASGPSGVRDGQGELLRAVELSVSANVSWRLVARSDPATPSADPVSAQASGQTVWVRPRPRSRGVVGVGDGYLEVVPSEPVGLAEGGPGGDQRIVLDYRWAGVDGAIPELVFELVAR